MTKEAVGHVLHAMDDNAIRERLAAGDFSDVEYDLDAHEREMVEAAAADYPEVAGFAVDAFIWFEQPKGDAARQQLFEFHPSYAHAVKYATFYR